MRYPVICKVFTEYHATSEIKHGPPPCVVDNPLVKACDLSLCTASRPSPPPCLVDDPLAKPRDLSLCTAPTFSPVRSIIHLLINLEICLSVQADNHILFLTYPIIITFSKNKFSYYFVVLKWLLLVVHWHCSCSVFLHHS